MRKSRTVISDVEADKIAADLNVIFPALEALEVAIPPWASMIFAFARLDRKSLDVSFFEDSKDFFVWYSKVMVRRDDVIAVSCQYDLVNKHWKIFIPPTLIGVNLKTKLR